MRRFWKDRPKRPFHSGPVPSFPPRRICPGTVRLLYLKDYDIEISPSAVMGDPVTDTLFRGTVLSITPRRVGQAMLIEGSALCQTDANPMRTLVTNVNGDAPLELPDLVRTAGKYRSELPNGEWVEIFRRARPTDGKLFIVKVRGVY